MSAKCFDSLLPLLEEASCRFKPANRPSSDKVRCLQQYCERIDALAAHYNGFAYDLEIDEETMEISIALEIKDKRVVISNPKDHILFLLVSLSEKFEIFTSQSGNLTIRFAFPSVWDNVSRIPPADE